MSYSLLKYLEGLEILNYNTLLSISLEILNLSINERIAKKLRFLASSKARVHLGLACLVPCPCTLAAL